MCFSLVNPKLPKLIREDDPMSWSFRGQNSWHSMSRVFTLICLGKMRKIANVFGDVLFWSLKGFTRNTWILMWGQTNRFAWFILWILYGKSWISTTNFGPWHFRCPAVDGFKLARRWLPGTLTNTALKCLFHLADSKSLKKRRLFHQTSRNKNCWRCQVVSETLGEGYALFLYLVFFHSTLLAHAQISKNTLIQHDSARFNRP